MRFDCRNSVSAGCIACAVHRWPLPLAPRPCCSSNVGEHCLCLRRQPILQRFDTSVHVQPLASVKDLTATGVAALGRQVAAPPTTEPRTFAVGRRRSVSTLVRFCGRIVFDCAARGCNNTSLAPTNLRRAGRVSGVIRQPWLALTAEGGRHGLRVSS